MIGALLLFGVALAVPLAWLTHYVYQQLRNGAFFDYRNAAEETVRQINERVTLLLAPEQARAFDEYSFFSASTSPLLNQKTVAFSPLSAFPVQSGVPGIMGYFQVNPDDSFHSPAVPDISVDEAVQAVPTLSREQFAQRLALKSSLESLLAGKRFHEKLRSPAAATSVASAAEPRTKSPGKLSELNLQTGLTGAEESLEGQGDYFDSAEKGVQMAPRKEKMNVVPQQQLLGLSRSLSLSGAPPEMMKDEKKEEKGNQPEETARQNAIFAVEGEVDPLQFMMLQGGRSVFFRKVWQKNQRYIQGFVVDFNAFISDMVNSSFTRSKIASEASLILSYRGNVVDAFRNVPQESGRREILLLKAPVVAPLDDLELVFIIQKIPYGPASSLVKAVVMATILIGLTGLFGIYRLGMRQIVLAEQQRDFVSSVSHELKTPLTSIRMYGEMLRSGMVPDEGKRKSYYDFIFHESERLSRLIANVLQVSRLSRNNSELAMEPHRVEELADIVRSKASSQAEAAGFSVDFDFQNAADEFSVLVDSDAFTQICVNLVDNALKFSAGCVEKKIRIGARVAADSTGEVTFFVRDFGPGIDKVQQKRIFELFYRGGDVLTRRTPGTGIGLALARELSGKMGARVDFKNENPGVEFRVIFPLAD